MRVVIDTNIFLVSISPKSKYYWVFEAFLNEEFTLCITNDILMEYEEILNNHIGTELSNVILQIVENAPNTDYITRYFEWNLIYQDPDDNKFVDCAIAANAKFLVTHDKHFNILKELDFPKVNILSADEFRNALKAE